jgi:hypothetical protein
MRVQRSVRLGITRAGTGTRALPNQRVRDIEKGSAWLLTEIEFARIFWRENFVATPTGTGQHWPESLLDELPVLNTVFVRTQCEPITTI